MAFTYNDPVIFLEYAVDVAAACRARGVKTVAVTAGEICPEPRREFFAAMDAANVDLKAFSERFYRTICGADLQPVLDTLVYLARETDVWLEITTLLIPGENDDDSELERMSAWIARELGPETPLHFSAFHPDYKMLDRPRTPLHTLERARRIALGSGLRYVYLGNVHDPEADSTWCPGCGELLIERDWYRLGRFRLDGGRCPACGEAVPGLFEDVPGTWGATRRPVRLIDAPSGRASSQ